jgi:hypothetical protein
MSNPTKNGLIAIIFVLTLSIGGFVFATYSPGKTGSLNLQLGEYVVEMELDEGELSIRDLILQFQRDEDVKRESQALLREFGGYYQASDPNVVEAIAVFGSDSEVAEKLHQKLSDLDSPFERESHFFYDVQDTSLVYALENLDFDHAVSQSLRQMLNERRGPFEESTKEVLLSVPAGNNIIEGRAAACKGGAYFRKNLAIWNLDRTREIDVWVSGQFPCTEDELDPEHTLSKLIQLSYADISRLLGPSPLSETEPALAQILVD